MKITLTFSAPNMHLGRILTWLHTILSVAPYECEVETEELNDDYDYKPLH